MDVLEPIEPGGMPGPVSPPSLGQPFGDPYGVTETMDAAPAPRRRRLTRALIATAVVAGIAGAAIGIGVSGNSGRSTLTFRPAASTGSSSSSGSSSSPGNTKHVRPGRRFGRIVAGTVSKVSGSAITVTLPKGTQTATVTTNAKTVYRKIVQGKVSDIKAKDTVAVIGTTASNGHLNATYIAIVPADLVKPAPATGTPKAPKMPPAPATPPAGAPRPNLPRLNNVVLGQVSSVNGTSFVVTRRDGTTVTVDTSTTTTKVFEEVAAKSSDVVANVHIAAIGTPGTTPLSLTATRIEILPAGLASQSGPMFGPGFGFGLPFGPGFGVPFGPGFGPGGFGGPGFARGFGHGWGPRGPMGKPGTGSGSSSGSSGSSNSGTATPQSVSA